MEIRRVPVGFDWPINKIWAGFVNPHYKRCPTCADGDSGGSSNSQRLDAFMRYIALAVTASLRRPDNFEPRVDWSHLTEPVDRWPFENLDPVAVFATLTGQTISDADARIIRCCAGTEPAEHHYRAQLARWDADRRVVIDAHGPMYYPHPYLCEAGIGDPGTTFCKLVEALPGFKLDAFQCETWEAEKAIMALAGVTIEGWYDCQTCGGEGIDPDSLEAYNTWEKSNPPAGPAYQLWETVSDGSPQSPAFEAPEALAAWLANNFKHERQSADRWLKFIAGPGWAPSMVVSDGRAMGGVDYMIESAVPETPKS